MTKKNVIKAVMYVEEDPITMPYDKLDKFFKENNGYNDEMLEEQIGLKKDKAKGVLEWYARLHLGQKIKKCVEEKEQCSFEAEL